MLLNMSRIRGDTCFHRQEQGSDFGAQFFFGIGDAIDTATEITVQAIGMSGPMPDFMQRGSAISSWRRESILRRHMNAVVLRPVEGSIRLVMMNDRAGVPQQSFGGLIHLPGGNDRRDIERRNTVNLFG